EWIKGYAEQLYVNFFLIKGYYNNTHEIESLRLDSLLQISEFKAQGMKFGIKTYENPTMEWEFNSLRAVIDTVFGIMVSGEDCPLKICKHDDKVFYAKNPKSEFCSPQCRNQFNVYKSRSKK
ncbi:hypothetical protein LJB89_03505, partial [Tyzzerella sp. OttesenSCG-928-J15]|nr:hypothetical protein [Tyzzerella sp. OttesenSCG-928-J15]